VEAVQPGIAGNLDAGSLHAIEGSLGLSAAVDNLEPTRGGSDRRLSGPNENDRRAILEQLSTRLLPEAETSLKSRLTQDLILIEDTGRVSQVLEEAYDPPLGQAGSVLKLDARIEFSFRVVSNADLERLAESTLNSEMEPGFRAVPESLAYVQASVPRTDEAGVTRWQMRLERRTLRSIDPAILLTMIRGQSPQSAASTLAGSFKWERPPQVALTPDWWPWLPLIPFRTSVIFR
jgi:hypothetical protein